MTKVVVIGAGLAGSEAANFLANKGIDVVLVEGKTVERNPSQKIDTYAELVCTNSLKSMKPDSGHGLLKYEMDMLGSLVLEKGRETAVPAGDALAVDRDAFSLAITQHLQSHPKIQIINEHVSNPLELIERCEADACIIATGPLTSEALSNWLRENISDDDFYFYDAIAPVVDADSLDYSKLFSKIAIRR